MKTILALLFIAFASPSFAIDADSLSEAVGYFILDTSTISASGENDAGEVFVKIRGHGEFTLSLTLSPPTPGTSVAILAKPFKRGNQTVYLYKLVVDDDLIDAHKTR